jgi:hypothetical protein
MVEEVEQLGLDVVAGRCLFQHPAGGLVGVPTGPGRADHEAMRGLVVMMPSVSMSDVAVLPEDAFGGVAVDDTHSETRRAPADRSRGD